MIVTKKASIVYFMSMIVSLSFLSGFLQERFKRSKLFVLCRTLNNLILKLELIAILFDFIMIIQLINTTEVSILLFLYELRDLLESFPLQT